MELDPDLIEQFSNLMVSTRPISAEELARFDENAPLRQRNEIDHPSYKTIPKFFEAPLPPGDTIRQNLRKEAHSLYLQQKSQELLDSNELDELWSMLLKHVTQMTATGQQLIDFDAYLQLQGAVNAKIRNYLTARLFGTLLVLSTHLDGMVDIVSVFNYIMRKVWLKQARIGLSFYDEMGRGYLRESDMESYIIDLIPNMAQIRDCMQPSFQSFYVCTVLKRFFFFLDAQHRGRICIRAMLESGMVTDLLDLREEADPEDPQDKNCFSMPAVLAVYRNYLSLDKDHNGMLSQKELADYGSGTLTTIFLERVFEECRTYQGEMDYKTYLDFDMAMNNRRSPQALQYLFRILDVDHKGYLTVQTLHFFFKGIQEAFQSHNEVPVNFEDINNEIFDMVKPNDPCKITLQDLIKSGKAETVVSILIEFHKFWAYETREENPQNV
ncbi:serine/threonine-protein phosphatase 2A regulatory subunit B'' subunit gamma-like [Drosophila pseudoobscura]|uniref:Serine/threonine-protein phosphatase 2A regulatory subunit B'' subunit gamma n=1 Tax=Drosophila pseudoobscura pseudoobscura TaxID=46245 RepID=A0A6I8V301_DROPS|nr:serine/threonine-protein phosphatase 2A regulatory subunit B'' subunit gamma [Drosophila pseudoobscura]